MTDDELERLMDRADAARRFREVEAAAALSQIGAPRKRRTTAPKPRPAPPAPRKAREPRPAPAAPARRTGGVTPGTATEDLVAEYTRGDSVGDIATRHGMHKSGVYGRLKRAGVTMRPRGPVATEQLVDEYRAGTDVPALATRHGLHVTGIYRRLHGAGITLRSKTTAPTETSTP